VTAIVEFIIKESKGETMAAKSELEKIKNFILKQFPLAKRKGITVDTPLLETGILDSMGVLDLVGFIEGEFQIGVNDEDLLPENFHSIGDIAAFVRHRTYVANS
jgi:acyl carrier protein